MLRKFEPALLKDFCSSRTTDQCRIMTEAWCKERRLSASRLILTCSSFSARTAAITAAASSSGWVDPRARSGLGQVWPGRIEIVFDFFTNLVKPGLFIAVKYYINSKIELMLHYFIRDSKQTVVRLTSFQRNYRVWSRHVNSVSGQDM